MLKDLRNYILEKDFRINIVDGKIDIVNYKTIDHFDDKRIIIEYENGVITVKGQNLIISKLLNDEVLISGSIEVVEFKWSNILKVKSPWQSKEKILTASSKG